MGGLTKTGSGKLTLGGVNNAGNTNVLNGTLAIGPGVTLAGGAGSLARDAGAQASVTVTGAGAKWDTGSNPIAVGVAGKGDLIIAQGGSVKTSGIIGVREHRRDGEYTQHGDGGRIWVRMGCEWRFAGDRRRQCRDLDDQGGGKVRSSSALIGNDRQRPAR